MAEDRYIYQGSVTANSWQQGKTITIQWTKPDQSLYVFNGASFGFTTGNNNGYRVVLSRRRSGQTKPTDIKQVNARSVADESYTFNLTSEELHAFDEVGSGATDTVILQFMLDYGLTGKTCTFSNIWFSVSYTSVATQSVVTISQADVGSAQTVTMTNELEVTHNIQWSYGPEGHEVTGNAQNVGMQYSIQIPQVDINTLIANCPNQNFVPGSITVQTLYDNNNVGTTTYSTRLSIPQTYAQSISIMSTQWDPSGDTHLQNSTVTVNVKVIPSHGASILSTVISTPDGYKNVILDSSNEGSAQFLTVTTGTYEISATVLDSRGFSQTDAVSPTPTVVAYNPPVITSITVVRCEDDGTEKEDGTYLKITATAVAQTQYTIYSMQCAYKQSGQQSYQNYETMTLSDNAYSKVIGGGGIAAEQGYDIKVKATDQKTPSAGITETTVSISSALYTIHRMAGGKGVAFGMASSKYGVEVNKDWPLYVHDKEIEELIVDYAHPVGSIIQTVDNSFNPNALWPWTQWGNGPDDNQTFSHTDWQTTTTDLIVKIWVRAK